MLSERCQKLYAFTHCLYKIETERMVVAYVWENGGSQMVIAKDYGVSFGE